MTESRSTRFDRSGESQTSWGVLTSVIKTKDSPPTAQNSFYGVNNLHTIHLFSACLSWLQLADLVFPNIPLRVLQLLLEYSEEFTGQVRSGFKVTFFYSKVDLVCRECVDSLITITNNQHKVK